MVLSLVFLEARPLGVGVTRTLVVAVVRIWGVGVVPVSSVPVLVLVVGCV